MTRGKYAAKAAKARAEDAQETIAELRRLLEEERAGHAQEVIDLKVEVQRLTGRLTKSVTEMSASEIARVKSECAATLLAEREKRQADALKVGQLFVDGDGVYLKPELWQVLATLLDVPLGKLLAASGIPTERGTRRMSDADQKHGQALIEQGYGPGGRLRGRQSAGQSKGDRLERI